MAPQRTKTDRQMEDQMLAVANDVERVDVINKARVFKRSWIELAEALSGVFERGSFERWGYKSFDEYCSKELHINKNTAAKLLGSFRFLKTSAPKVIERARNESDAPVPSLKVIDFVRKAEARGAADGKAMREIKHAAFEEGAEAPMLVKRFKSVAFPMSSQEQTDKLRTQLLGATRRLAQLIADPDAPVPHKIAVSVEEALGRLLEVLEA